MADARYAHAQVQFNSLPILEAQDIEYSEESAHEMVHTRGHTGVLPSIVPTKCTISFDVQIPKTGHEADYWGALREGTMVTVRFVDVDEITDSVGLVKSITKRDPFEGTRTCSIRFEGNPIV